MEQDRYILTYARKHGMSGVQARKLLERKRTREKYQENKKDIWARAKSFVHCCGQWYPVVSLPFVVPCCYRTFRIAVKRSALHLGCVDRDQLIAHGVVEAGNKAGGID